MRGNRLGAFDVEGCPVRPSSDDDAAGTGRDHIPVVAFDIAADDVASRYASGVHGT